jgi:4-amino-4-deoxy-L-arabinose transferase-like glycosyltransferase
MSLLVFLIGPRLVDEVTGLVAAALTAVYGYFIYYNAALMTETFFIIFVLFALYLGLELKERPTRRSWVLLGLALGVAGLLRQTALLFVPFLFLWLAWEQRKVGLRWRSFLIPVAVMALLILPWIVRNYLVYDQFPLLNSNAGYALYASSNPALETDWRNDRVVIPIPEALRGANEAELNEALTRQGIEFIVSDPVRYLKLSIDKIWEFIKFWPSSDSSRTSNLVRGLSFGLYLPFMIMGLWLSLARRRDFMLLYLFVVIHSGIHLLSWPSLRYRLPVDAISMIFAALALLELARQFVVWRRRVSPDLQGLSS